ncbi:MAG: translocation/assembly module TamB domain-containing protein, partial [Blastocatellia bacterium]|nr:translocation/assembly module TamB domain-containing protein [Blastocatellia bacterium]
PLTIELDAMQVKVSSTRITGPGFDLSFNGKLGLAGEAGMDFSLKGNANLGQLPTFDSGLTLTGAMAIDARASGTAQEPRVAGKVDVKQFGMTSKSLPVIIADGAGSLMLAGDRLTLEKFTAKINDGALEVNGQSMLEKMQPSEWRFNIKARNAVINYQDIAATANGDLTLNGNRQRQTLGGTITIPQAEYVPKIDLDNLIAGGATGLGSGGVGIGGASLRRSGIPPIDLNIRLQAVDSVVVQNKQINAVGSAILTLGGTLTNQDVIGRIESDGGTVRFRGQRYDITSGSIDFPPGAGEPQLNLTAESDISNYRVTIGFVGPVNAIELTLQSEPQLSRDELVALITTGREEIGTMTSQDLLRTGVGGAASLVTSGFISKPTEELLGISHFTIDPVIRPNENPAARLTIGQQFSRNLYLSYSTNLSSEQDQTALAEYTLTSRFSALTSFTQGGINSADQNNNNVFTIELRGRKRFSLGFITGGTVAPAGKGPAANSKHTSAPKLPGAAVSVNQVDDLNLKDHKLRELLPVMSQGFSHSLARLGESRLREYLQEQGYFFAEVDYRCEPEDCSGDNLKVYYDVEPYQKYDLEEIRIEGTNQIKLQDVKDQLQSQTASRVGGVPFLKNLPLVGGYVRGLTSNDRLRNDAETIRRSLRDQGFRNATVQSRWAVRPDSDSLVVIFDVAEGPQAIIAGVNLRGNNVLSAEELQQVIPIRRGDAFSR